MPALKAAPALFPHWTGAHGRSLAAGPFGA